MQTATGDQIRSAVRQVYGPVTTPGPGAGCCGSGTGRRETGEGERPVSPAGSGAYDGDGASTMQTTPFMAGLSTGPEPCCDTVLLGTCCEEQAKSDCCGASAGPVTCGCRPAAATNAVW
jgi:hypothetical protein